MFIPPIYGYVGDGSLGLPLAFIFRSVDDFSTKDVPASGDFTRGVPTNRTSRWKKYPKPRQQKRRRKPPSEEVELLSDIFLVNDCEQGGCEPWYDGQHFGLFSRIFTRPLGRISHNPGFQCVSPFYVASM